DNALFLPQPYHSSIGHLTVIPAPDFSLKHPLQYAWYQPVKDFIEVDDAALVGIGCLSLSLETGLQILCSHLL
ncbi:hypothetical protein GYMLUDRAFT_114914, partial [Collybiopsis luxurians FD-317 M1]